MKFNNYSSEPMVEITTNNGLTKMIPANGPEAYVAIDIDLAIKAECENEPTGDYIPIFSGTEYVAMLPAPKIDIMNIVNKDVHEFIVRQGKRKDTCYCLNGRLMI